MCVCVLVEACFDCVLVSHCFVMGYVLQFGETAHKRVYYYYTSLRIVLQDCARVPPVTVCKEGKYNEQSSLDAGILISAS